MPSPRPLPTNLKVVRGTAKPCRLNDKEPSPKKLKTIRPPDSLTAAEKKCWRRTVTDLQAAGIITVIDTVALAAYCRAWVGYQSESEMVEEEGSVVTGGMGGPVVSPHFKASSEYFKRLLQLWREFGMTPSSRTRIRAEKEEDDDDYNTWCQKQKEKRRIAREGV